MKKTERAWAGGQGHSRGKSRSRLRMLAGLWLGGVMLAAGGCALHSSPSESAVMGQRILPGLRASMVPVRVYFKRDPSGEFGLEQGSFQERLARQMVETKMSLDLGGVVLDRQGRVLITDPEIQPRFIDHFEVIDSAGKTHRAELITVLKKMEAAVIQVDEAEALQPISFGRSKELDEFLQSRREGKQPRSLPALLAASIYRSGRDWQISIAPLTASYRHNSASPAPQYYLGSASRGGSGQAQGSETMGQSPSLILDEDGNFLGVTIRGVVDLDQQDSIWMGQDVLAAAFADLNAEAFFNSLKALDEQYAEIYHQVKIYYRQPSEEDVGQPVLPERIVYGLALDDSRLLIPAQISRREAKQIEAIEVQLNGQDELTGNSGLVLPGFSTSKAPTARGEFIGAYRDFAAFLVEVKEAKLGRHLEMQPPGQIAKTVPVYTIRAWQRSGRKYLQVWYARCLGEGKDYGDVVRLQPSTEIDGGSVLLDLQKHLAGLYMRERIPNEEQRIMEVLGAEQAYQFGDSGSRMTHIYELEKVGTALANPADWLDPNIKAMTKDQAKRRMWLGVEYVPVNRQLVERLALEQLTKDGLVGFMVSTVYAGSPAERIGLQPGDVLLRIKDQAREYPTELWTSLAGPGRGPYSGSRMPPASGEETSAMVWPSRQNFLTEFLAAIGQGQKIDLTFCTRDSQSKWQVITKQVEVEQAPLDYDSAARYRDRSMGFTVRDLSYEVRKALRLADTDPGVVVSKVEEGAPAAVAKIDAGELITRIDGAEVGSVKDFQDRIIVARQSSAATVKVEISRLGKTRVADISLGN